jgi:hypothetical protein
MFDGIVLVVSNITMFLVAVGMGALYIWDRQDSRTRERELLSAIIAEHAGEYLSMVEALKTSPKDKLKQTLAENDLALNAARLKSSEGLPVTN